jgi:rfaE bifunctional protein nucleotidyltransferase chain/domain
MSKLVSLVDLSHIVSSEHLKGNTVVMCHGVFDVIHAGHIQHFKESKKLGDVLIVTVTQDKYVNKGPGRPFYTELNRAEIIANLEVVDFVAINEFPTAVDTLLLVKPDIYAKGKEYSGKSDGAIAEETKAVESVGGKIAFTDGVVFSSSKYINSITMKQTVKDYLSNFKYTYDEIRN